MKAPPPASYPHNSERFPRGPKVLNSSSTRRVKRLLSSGKAAEGEGSATCPVHCLFCKKSSANPVRKRGRKGKLTSHPSPHLYRQLWLNGRQSDRHSGMNTALVSHSHSQRVGLSVHDFTIGYDPSLQFLSKSGKGTRSTADFILVLRRGLIISTYDS